MRWLADECVAAGLVAWLRAAGHDAAYAAETMPAAKDSAVMAASQAEARILLTEDKDFGELVFRSRQLVPGLVLLRIDAEKNLLKQARLEAAVRHFGDSLFGCYTVVEESRFRSRALLML